MRLWIERNQTGAPILVTNSYILGKLTFECVCGYIYIVFIFIYYASNTDELLTDKRLSNVRMPSSKSRKCNIQRDSISDFQDPSLRVSRVLLRAPLPAGHASRLEEEGLKKTGGYAPTLTEVEGVKHLCNSIEISPEEQRTRQSPAEAQTQGEGSSPLGKERGGGRPRLTALSRNQPCRHLDLGRLASRSVRQ